MLFGIGVTATVWLPPLYFRLFPPAFPRAVEPLIMGMPLVFDRKAARDTRASIQFRVSGSEPGDYYLDIARGRCRSFEGIAPAADLTVYTPGTVWLKIAHGELDGERALRDGLYRAEGDRWYAGGMVAGRDRLLHPALEADHPVAEEREAVGRVLPGDLVEVVGAA